MSLIVGCDPKGARCDAGVAIDDLGEQVFLHNVIYSDPIYSEWGM